MRAGKWVVLKDVDRGSAEALGLLTPLIESMAPNKRIGVRAKIFVPGRGEVDAADSFMLFATRSVDGGSKQSHVPPTFITGNKWAEVVANPPDANELKEIVESKFPILQGPVADGLIDIWRSAKQVRTVSSTRSIGIRDLEKFCRRVSSLLQAYNVSSLAARGSDGATSFTTLIPNPSLREDIFLEARDVFFASGAPTKAAQAQLDTVCALIGERLGLPSETQEWVLHRRTPDFNIEKDVDGRLVAVRAGRTRLAADKPTEATDSGSTANFSMHKPALKLISQLATCVAAAEPVLLTGETGTGKTTIVTYLSSLLNRPLLSLNMSNQTESSDLIGGFKPVNARVPALELQNRFVEMFAKTFSKKRNESFEGSLRRAINEGKWKSAVKLWSSAAKMAIDKIKERKTEEAQS
jgi:midasin